ncbi:hypothetical protein SPRG_06944 [Saprolegnia parasitica CBS 223.65]|uniref:Uncharacterized protein n=1 Tax=Saprolegnia parasitica (strain CBS 223.65) TaxID=695850 RepID=A0A067CLD5_SAPPC|nr:hypothetical protein SPRG_06944 [Saprolegnia parasitica CBS 223.65]KDO27356.1 hypothetical protein SPRG_06944 [Saprolegnia parasitica CBS 223.65]|eukprot:XP_012201800.1 hypothetical protein SPRG_06944 [Saprolegnia parasitica CBS 223.65]
MKLTEKDIERLPYHTARSYCGKHSLGTKGLASELRQRIRIHMGYDAQASDDESDDTLHVTTDHGDADLARASFDASDEDALELEKLAARPAYSPMLKTQAKSVVEPPAKAAMKAPVEEVPRVGIAVPDLARFMNSVQGSLLSLGHKMDAMASNLGSLHVRVKRQEAQVHEIHAGSRSVCAANSPEMIPIRARLQELEAENAVLRAQLSLREPSAGATTCLVRTPRHDEDSDRPAKKHCATTQQGVFLDTTLR